MIYAPARNTDPATVTSYLQDTVKLVEAFPDFIIGFDLAGQEDIGQPLMEFISEILSGLEQNPGFRLFFHAGETSWQGTTTDMVIVLLHFSQASFQTLILKLHLPLNKNNLKLLHSRFSVTRISYKPY